MTLDDIRDSAKNLNHVDIASIFVFKLPLELREMTYPHIQVVSTLLVAGLER